MTEKPISITEIIEQLEPMFRWCETTYPQLKEKVQAARQCLIDNEARMKQRITVTESSLKEHPPADDGPNHGPR